MERDPHSASNIDEVIVKHLALTVECSFATKTFAGNVLLTCNAAKTTTTVTLDVLGLDIQQVQEGSGSPCPFEVLECSPFGKMLSITLPSAAEAGAAFDLNIVYTTTAASAAIQWLEPGQTRGKEHPYCFTQSQVIAIAADVSLELIGHPARRRRFWRAR